MAPKATIDVVESAGTFTTDPVDLSALYIVDTNLAGIMNLSFQQCEQNLGSAEDAFWNALFEQAAAQGISVFVASGDAGAGGCSSFASSGQLGVNGLSSTPFNTSVGGLQFDETINGALDATFWNAGDAIGYIPEAVWNDCALTACGGAGGGGISNIYAVPSWQTLPLLGLTGAHYPNRVLPDVSLAASEAHDPYVICYSPFGPPGDCQVTGGVPNLNNFGGGTSFGSPELAGVMALIDQALGGRQGLANFQFYSLAAAESSSYPACNSSTQINPATPPGSQCIFNDVTTGTNGVDGDSPIVFVPPGNRAGQPGYNAVPGYDAASGLGSMNAATLVNAWVTAEAKFNGSATTVAASFNGTALPSNTVSVVHGQAVSVTVSVAALSSNKSQTPSTDVSLLAQGGNLPSNIGIGFAPISGSGGTATSGAVSVKNLPGGTNYNLSAYFPGDGVFAGSTSNSIAVTVAPENTTTALQAGTLGQLGGSINPITTVDYGDLSNILAFNATVAGQSQFFPSSGTVTFTDNGNFLAAVDLSALGSGLAQFVDCFPAAPCLGLGQHVITATYSGDGPPASYNGSTSSSFTLTITKSNTNLVSVRVPAATAIAGQSVNLNTFIITEAGAVQPTGAIQFLDGTTPLGPPVPLGQDTNTATMATFATTGNHVVTAQYPGDALYNAATSPATTLVILAPFALTSAAPAQTILQGATATFNLSLTNSGFAGNVMLTCTPANPSLALQCTLPASETLAAATATVPFNVTVASAAMAQSRPSALMRGSLMLGYGVFFAAIFYKRKERPRLALLFMALALTGIGACGGGGSGSTGPTSTSTAFTVTATSGSQSTNIGLLLTIDK
jgi:Bacterial Ig-like domain (group 3)